MMKRNKVKVLLGTILLIIVMTKSVFAQEMKNQQLESIGIQYITHIQDKGWETQWKTDGELSGTVGESKRLEALQVKLTGDYPTDASVETKVHVQNEGDLGPFLMGSTAGTEGKGLRLESIKLELKNLPGYSLKYNVQVENLGWLKDTADKTKWFNSGETAGTSGQGLRLEGICIRLVKDAVNLTEYNKALLNVKKENYTKASWEQYQKVVDANLVSEMNTQSEIDLATANILEAQKLLEALPEILEIKAVGQKTIEISGNNLKNISDEEIEVQGNKINEIDVNSEGTKSLIYLDTDLSPGENISVTTKIGEETQEYSVNYVIQGNSIAITSSVFDDDLANQQIELLVDGTQTTGDYLQLAGFNLNILAWDENGTDVTSQLFGTGTNNNGRLNQYGFTSDANFYVQAILSNGESTVTSEKTAIKIRNLNKNESNFSQIMITDMMNNNLDVNNLVLAKGCVLSFSKVFLEDPENCEISPGNYQITSFSPDKVVIIRNPVTQRLEIKGVGSGTASLFFSVGKVTKTVNIEIN